MDDPAEDRWSESFPWLTATGTSRLHRKLLAQAEVAQRVSATQLRAAGRLDAAQRAELFAAWARFRLDEPGAAEWLHAAIRDLRATPDLGRLAEQALAGASWLLGADRGNVQLADPGTGTLRIVAQRGFGPEFLAHFAVVTGDSSVCGRAAGQGSQIVVPDVTADPGFAPHRDLAAAAGFRAVQSTPFTGRDGSLIGVLSTHYPGVYRPPDRDLKLVRRYAGLVGQIIAEARRNATDGHDG